MTLEAIKWNEAGLVPVVVQDRHTGEVRMVAHANAEAAQLTVETGFAHFYSRSRNELWKKGQSSGNTLRVQEVWTDCDADTLLYLVDPNGPSCHTGARNCFLLRVSTPSPAPGPAAPSLVRLTETLAARRNASSESSYTRKLLDGGFPYIDKKLLEETHELMEAWNHGDPAAVRAEAADIIYHLLVGLVHAGVDFREVEHELARRSGMSGLEEKASRDPK